MKQNIKDNNDTNAEEDNEILRKNSAEDIGKILKNSIEMNPDKLYFTQAIQWFKLFADMDLSAIEEEVVFILAKMFHTLLMHVKMLDPSLPSHVNKKYGELIHLTVVKLKKSAHVLLDENRVSLQRAHLLLCNGIGRVYLALFKESADLGLFDVLSKPEVFLNGKDQVISLLVFQLLILKIEGLIHKAELSQIELTELKATISIVVQHAEENICKGASWDLDLNTLSTYNYGTAVWRKLLEFLPLILHTIESKDLLKICRCSREIIMKGDFLLDSDDVETTNLRSIVLLSLQSMCYQQSKYFQSSLISSVWKLDCLLLSRKRNSNELETGDTFIKVLNNVSSFRRKWRKYEESTPKSEELNPVWSGVKEMCSNLNEILQSNSILRPKVKAKVYNILQLIDCIPLRYLLPVNQVRCVIGLSTLFFLIPESCESAKALKIAGKVAEQLITIFDGERSIWLFDFVVSGPYLREMMNTIERLAERGATDVPDSCKLLLKHLVNLVTKNPKALSEAKDYFSEEKCLNNVILNFFARICKHNQHITSLVPNDQQCYSTTVTVLGESQYVQISNLKNDEVELLLRLFPLLSPKELSDVFGLSNQEKSVDQWMEIFNICLTIQLEKLSNNLSIFIKTFEALYNCLSSSLIHHPGFVLKTAPVFMMIVTNLLKSLVLAGSQDAVHGSTKDIQDGMLRCSQNMAGLLNRIARHKTEFAKLVPFLIGDYADSVQHNTLEPKIKGNLIAAMNEMMSMCNENSLKMVLLCLQSSCREIFRKIVTEHNQSRYHGYV